MQSQKRIVDDIAKVAGGALGALGSLKQEIENLVKQRVDRFMADHDLVSREEFQEMITRDQLLEHATVHGEHLYGTPAAELERASSLGKHLILEIDLQGARQIREHEHEAIQFFVHPPSWEELERRLRDRATETESEIQTRLATARSEIAAAGEFEHQVTNDNLSECAEEIVRTVRGRDR